MFALHCLSWLEFAWDLSPNLEANRSYIYNSNIVDFETAVVLNTFTTIQFRKYFDLFLVLCSFHKNINTFFPNGQEQCVCVALIIIY